MTRTISRRYPSPLIKRLPRIYWVLALALGAWAILIGLIHIAGALL